MAKVLTVDFFFRKAGCQPSVGRKEYGAVTLPQVMNIIKPFLEDPDYDVQITYEEVKYGTVRRG